jgi:glycosyltransferase involved in cell wall biosynthesis
MKLWIFNPYEPLPHEGAVRLRYASLSKALIEAGHAVTWWSADWSHTLKKRRLLQSEGRMADDEGRIRAGRGDQEPITGQLFRGACDDKTGCEADRNTTGKLELVLLPVPAYRRNISLARIWSHWRYAKGIERRADDYVAEHGEPDIILFSVPPMEAGCVALKLGKRFGAKVVLDVMDAWPDTLLRLPAAAMANGGWRMAKVTGFGAGGSEPGAARKFRSSFIRHLSSFTLSPYSRMMQRYCRKADAVCAQSQAFAEYARSFGASGEIPVFHLAAHAPFKECHSPLTTPHSPLASTVPLRLIYLGSMGRVYDLITLVDAVIHLSNEGLPIHLDLIGDGEQRPQLASRVAEAGKADIVTIHGYVQGARLDALLAQADIGVIPRHPESGVAIPYMAPHYLSQRLYILSSLPGELKQKLEQAGCGAYYPAGDVKALADAIRQLAEDPEALKRGKTQAVQLFKEQFESEKVHAAMAEWLCGALGAPG